MSIKIPNLNPSLDAKIEQNLYQKFVIVSDRKIIIVIIIEREILK